MDVGTDSVRVRSAYASDVLGVLAVDHRKERADAVRIAVLDSRALVAEVGEEIVGFCIGGDFFGFDFLELLVVAPAYRRRGIGGALVIGWEQRAQSVKLFTSTNESNVPMQCLCESLGYVRSGVIENLDAHDPEIVYFKARET